MTFPANLVGLKQPPDYLRGYNMPDHRGNKDIFVGHASRFPNLDRPEVFGIHFNAQQAMTEGEGLNILNQVFAFDQTKNSKLYNTKSMNLALDETDPGKLKRYKAKLKDVTFYTPKVISMA